MVSSDRLSSGLGDAVCSRLFELGARGGGRFANPGEMFESVISDIYRLVLTQGDLVVDGGANTGQHSFPMAACVGESGVVLAVEAIPRIAKALEREVGKRNIPQVRVVPKALYDRETSITYNVVENNPGYSGIKRRDYDFDANISEISVETTTIDALIAAFGAGYFRARRRRWRFCKLDLEGGELRALQGAHDALKKHRPLVVFENGQDASARYYGYSAEEWFEFFDSVGYHVFTLWGHPFTRADWGRTDIPWYFIAAPANSGETSLLLNQLPSLIQPYLQ